MSNIERSERWLEIVKEDLSVAEDLYKTGHWLYVAFMYVLCRVIIFYNPYLYFWIKFISR